jgi:hypothetical protein
VIAYVSLPVPKLEMLKVEVMMNLKSGNESPKNWNVPGDPFIGEELESVKDVLYAKAGQEGTLPELMGEKWKPIRNKPEAGKRVSASVRAGLLPRVRYVRTGSDNRHVYKVAADETEPASDKS